LYQRRSSREEVYTMRITKYMMPMTMIDWH
jgi:hypothetical protein